MMRFRLLAGKHVQRGQDGTTKVYVKGDIVEHDRDLVALLGANKFSLVGESKKPPKRVLSEEEDSSSKVNEVEEQNQVEESQEEVVEDTAEAEVEEEQENASPDFDTMNLRQMKAYAAEHNIDLRGAVIRKDVLKVLKSS